ncbi:MAG: ABC transporter permease [Terracidiphilus sp.]|jgi:putative ABC transport system permease protein
MPAEKPTTGTEGGWPARALCLLIMTGEGMWINKFQLCLTLLTMAVGSFALSLTFFLGDGAKIYLFRDMEQLMGDWIIASPATHYDSAILMTRFTPDFTAEDLDFVKDKLGHTRLVEPIYQDIGTVTYHEISRTMAVDGVTAELGREPLFSPIKGRGFSESGRQLLVWECMLTESAVKVLGIDIAKNPTILIDGRPFNVVGVTPDPPDSDSIFRSRIIVPYSCAQELWIPAGTVGKILVAWSSPQFMSETVSGLHAALDSCHGPDTYFLSSSQFKIQKSRSIIANFMMYGQMQAFFCIAIAFVGVMNVMLTNTARRSNEFAIRLSMGARQSTILTMVLLESSLVGIAGAVAGIIIAACAAPYAAHILQQKINGTGELLPYYGVQGFLYPVLVCSLAGLIAGIMPAINVRKLDVLACLRNNT